MVFAQGDMQIHEAFHIFKKGKSLESRTGKDL